MLGHHSQLCRVLPEDVCIFGRAVGLHQLGKFYDGYVGLSDHATLRANPGAFEWDEDLPASYHGKACGISFADGHSEIHSWKVASTMPPLAVGELTGGKGSGQTWLAPYSKDVSWMQDVTARPK